jgi:hypothetical protein
MVYHFDEPQVIQSAGGLLGAIGSPGILLRTNSTGGSLASLIRWIGFQVARSWFGEELSTKWGMLDERFFYYFEETEWCLRARRKVGK